ncbi:MAG: tetratricopeptide repeat protein [Thermodesulfobacteriota bacterium]
MQYPDEDSRQNTSLFRRHAGDVAAMCALVVIAAVVYAAVIDQRFCNWDDGKHVEAIWPPGWDTARKLVLDLNLNHTGTAYYSPLHFLSLMLDQLLIGRHPHPEPWIAKVVNVGFHAANSLLVLRLLLVLGVGRLGALIGALVFVLHPLQVGTVAWVAERKNLLCTFFYLTAVVLYLRYLETDRVWLGAAVFLAGFAGLLSKPAAVTLPVVLVLLRIVQGRTATGTPRVDDCGRSHPPLAPPIKGGETQTLSRPSLGGETQTLSRPSLGGETQTLSRPSLGGETQTLSRPSLGGETLALSLPSMEGEQETLSPGGKGKGEGVRVTFHSPADSKPSDSAGSIRGTALLGALFAVSISWGLFVLSTERTFPAILPPLGYRPLIAAGGFWFYLWKFVAPFDLAVVYPRWDVVRDPAVFLPLLAGAAGLALGLWRFRTRIDRLILWGVLFYVVNLLPVSGLVPFGYMVHSFVADHFAYLPMVGLCLVCVRVMDLCLAGLGRLSARVLLAGVCVWLCVLGVLSVRQVAVWRDSAALWEATLRVNTSSPAVYNNFGLVCLDGGDYSRALSMFQRALELAPRFDTAWYNAGKAYLHMGDRVRAREMYRKALELNPGHESARFMLAELLKDEGKLAEARDFLKDSVTRVPDSAVLRSQLGMMWYRLGNVQEALAHFNEALTLDSRWVEALVYKAEILLERGGVDEAIALANRALQVYPDPQAYHLLGVANAMQGRFDDAVAQFEAAARLNPSLPGLRDNLANALSDAGSIGRAREYCAQAAKAGNPCSEETLTRLREAGP